MVKIGYVVDQTLRDELIDQLLTKAIDLHCPAARPVEQRLLQLSWTGLRQAAAHSLAFLSVNLAAADGAPRRHHERNAIRRTLYDTDDLRYDVAAAFQ